MHITNINRCLKKAKLNIIADFIWVESKDIIITTNKATLVSDISIIEKYLKENSNINSDYINSSCLLKSKSYLKILDLSYIVEKTNLLVTSKLIEEVIKEFYIFKDIILASRPQVIKASPKSDIAIIIAMI